MKVVGHEQLNHPDQLTSSGSQLRACLISTGANGMICGIKQAKWERQNSEQKNTHWDRLIRPIITFIAQLENASIAL